LLDNAGALQGNVATGTTTDDTSLNLTGTLGGASDGAFLAIGESLRVYDGSTFLGNATVSVVVGGQSTWAYSDSRILNNGQALSYTARVADAALNQSAAGTAYTATVVTPAAVSGLVDNAGALQGNVVTGSTTDDTSLSLTGTLGGATDGAALAAGENVRVYDGSTFLGNATVSVVAGGQSTWTYSDSRILNNGQALSYTARIADAALNESVAGTPYTTNVDTTAPTTVTHTRGAYKDSTNTLVLTGTNFNTLLETGESSATDIKERLDWSKLSWDINGDNGNNDVSFLLADISSAKVTNDTRLSIVLNADKGTSLEATSGYGGAADDKLDIAVGFARDMAGNAATTDALLNGSLFQSVIDLGSFGKLIAPVQVEADWYYYWDRSGDGTSANTGTLNGSTDRVTHDQLDLLFTMDNSGATGGEGNTTDTFRFGSLNGVAVALPTANRGAYPQQLFGTAYSDAGATTNGTTSTYDGLLAVWDAYNGTSTSTTGNGTPPGWINGPYLSATPVSTVDTHFIFQPGNGTFSSGSSDTTLAYVALVVL
jgi:hypothetical protein